MPNGYFRSAASYLCQVEMQAFVMEKKEQKHPHKITKSLYIQHPAEVERLFQLSVQLSKNVFVVINRTT